MPQIISNIPDDLQFVFSNCYFYLKELSEVQEDPAFAQERARHAAVIQHQRRYNNLEILSYMAEAYSRGAISFQSIPPFIFPLQSL